MSNKFEENSKRKITSSDEIKEIKDTNPTKEQDFDDIRGSRLDNESTNGGRESMSPSRQPRDLREIDTNTPRGKGRDYETPQRGKLPQERSATKQDLGYNTNNMNNNVDMVGPSPNDDKQSVAPNTRGQGSKGTNGEESLNASTTAVGSTAMSPDLDTKSNSDTDTEATKPSEVEGANESKENTNRTDLDKETPRFNENNKPNSNEHISKSLNQESKGVEMPKGKGQPADIGNIGGDSNPSQAMTNKLGDSVKEKLNSETVKKAEKTKKTIDNTKKGLETTKVGFQILWGILSNPITWISLVVGLIIIALLSGSQLLGRSDFANNCAPNGSLALGAELPEDEMERANIVGTWLMTTSFPGLGGKPMSKEQAAGALGNFHGESSVNPKILETSIAQGDSEAHLKWNEDKLLSTYGDSSNHAIGMAQWDSGRRVGLLKFAKEQKKPWWDAELQLAKLESEINGAEKASLQKEFIGCKSVESCTEAWRRDFERGGEGDLPKRLSFANDWIKQYKGGSSSGMSTSGMGSSGKVANCGGNSNIDMSDIVKLAIDTAYPSSEYSKSNVSGGDLQGRSNAKPSYKKMKTEAEANGGKDTFEDPLYASCDRYVASLLKSTKLDVDVPWGPTGTQYSYFKSSSKWQEVKCGDRKPGDIMITKGDGHVMIYLGMIDGKDSLASASFHDRVAAVGNFDGCSGDSWNGDNLSNLAGFRLK